MAPTPGVGTGSRPEDIGPQRAIDDESEALSANTEDKSEDLQPSSKKRKMAAGGRGVAHMTPEQLAKKRANGKQCYLLRCKMAHAKNVLLTSRAIDREAQRAIRERTKNQIQELERRIEELTNQKPYQELQAVVRAKEAVERENEDMRKRLADIVGLLQPMIGQSVGIKKVYQTTS